MFDKYVSNIMEMPEEPLENRTEEMAVEMRKICEYLNTNCRFFDPTEALEKIILYINDYDRFLYSELSSYYFKHNGSGDNIGFISQNMQTLSDYVTSIKAEKFEVTKGVKVDTEELRKIVLKFLDHLRLADSQVQYLNQDKFYEHFWEERKDIEDSIKEEGHKLNKELISLVAIFTAMAFLVFGGLSSLSDILELSFKNFSVLNISFVGIIWGICIFNLIYLFMYLVSKIICVNVASEAPYYFDKRHRVYIMGNTILVTAFAICSWIYIIKTDYLGIYSEFTSIFGKFAFLVPFAVVVAVMFLYFVVYKRLIKFIHRKISQQR